MRRKTLRFFVGFFAILCNFSCVKNFQELATEASQIGSQQGLEAKIYQTKTFRIFTLQKITDATKPLRIYVEGDGRAFINRYSPSKNPTPISHFLLDVMAQDDSPNLVYVARPCQFVEDTKCEEKFWTNGRFAPEVVAAIDEVLQNFSAQKIELIGYSGGGFIALQLATKNKNVINLRTIAGNLDHQKFVEFHQVSALDQSASDPDFNELAELPQIHFVGAKDRTTPAIIAQSYVSKLPQQNCSKIVKIAAVNHSTGWMERWEELLKIVPQCTAEKFKLTSKLDR